MRWSRRPRWREAISCFAIAERKHINAYYAQLPVVRSSGTAPAVAARLVLPPYDSELGQSPHADRLPAS